MGEVKATKTLKIIYKNILLFLVLLTSLSLLFSFNHSVFLQNKSNALGTQETASYTSPYKCGSGSSAVSTSIDFGCKGDVCVKNASASYCKTSHNGIIDLVFAIIRFLSDGVGIVVVASIVFGGISYITSGGDPNKTNKAIARIRSSIIALMIYIFAYAILNYIIPGTFFHQ